MADDKDNALFEEKDWLFKGIVEVLPSLSFTLSCAFVYMVAADLFDGASWPYAFLSNHTYVAWAATLYCMGRIIPLFMKLARQTRIYP